MLGGLTWLNFPWPAEARLWKGSTCQQRRCLLILLSWCCCRDCREQKLLSQHSPARVAHTTEKQRGATDSMTAAASHFLQQWGSKVRGSRPRSAGRCSRCLQWALPYRLRDLEDAVETISASGPARFLWHLGKWAASRQTPAWLLGKQSWKRARQDELRPIAEAASQGGASPKLRVTRRQAGGETSRAGQG